MKENIWRDFKTKTAITNAIRDIVNPQPDKMPFESSLLSDLIVERHYFCSLRGLRPSRFRKIPAYGPKGYDLQGDFSGQATPTAIEWHGVSWTKCLRPPWTDWERIVRAMRDRVEPEKAQYKESHPTCEMCRQRPTEEAHHSNPSFLVIADCVRERVSEAQIVDCLGAWNWFHPKNFGLPDGQAVTAIFDELHATARLQALCRQCHNTTKGKKRD